MAARAANGDALGRSALCVVLLASAASAQTAAKSGQVYLPTTPGDFSGMILSLMERQMNLLAGADGVEVRICVARALRPRAHGSTACARRALLTRSTRAD